MRREYNSLDTEKKSLRPNPWGWIAERDYKDLSKWNHRSKCFLTTIGYLNSFLAFNKQLNCICRVCYFGLKGIILSRDIIDYYSIIVKVNPWVTGLALIESELISILNKKKCITEICNAHKTVCSNRYIFANCMNFLTWHETCCPKKFNR